jgi:hypothetical protein
LLLLNSNLVCLPEVPQGKSLLSPSAVNLKARPLPPYEYEAKLNAIKAAIPKHCFEHSYLTSFRYLFVDLAVSAALFYAVSFLEHMSLHPAASFLLYCTYFSSAVLLRYFYHAGLTSRCRYAAYWLCQGCILTGVWVIAHECGHGGFSPNAFVNDVVGSICHSFLLVPYWSWKFSHAKVRLPLAPVLKVINSLVSTTKTPEICKVTRYLSPTSKKRAGSSVPFKILHVHSQLLFQPRRIFLRESDRPGHSDVHDAHDWLAAVFAHQRHGANLQEGRWNCSLDFSFSPQSAFQIRV